MFISKTEMQDDKTLASKIKNWAGRLNIAAKKEIAPTFKVGGPEVLRCRARRGGAGMVSLDRNFMGGEEFRIGSVLLESDVRRDGVEILFIFNPADLALASEVSSLSLPLARAIEVFTGLSDWVDVSLIEPAGPPPAPDAPVLPTVTETRASAKWGAW